MSPVSDREPEGERLNVIDIELVSVMDWGAVIDKDDVIVFEKLSDFEISNVALLDTSTDGEEVKLSE